MKKPSIYLKVILLVASLFFLYLTFLDITSRKSIFARFNHEQYKYNGIEEFDPSLIRLNTIEKLRIYCDSLFEARYFNVDIQGYEMEYVETVNSVTRKKFYHGYSSYGFGNNYAALMLEPLTGFWASAIVIPDDIAKYPYAACSQQSIVMMELLRNKKIVTRKVGFDGKEWGGHFCLEAFYNGSWHFYDPNREPDVNILASYNRPGIDAIAKNDNLLLSLYKNMPQDQVLATYKNYFYGKPNVFEAPRARAYQVVTKILSYILWIFPLIGFLLAYRKYVRLSSTNNVWNSWFYLLRFTKKGSPTYYGNSGA